MTLMPFASGRLDHVHCRVPDRACAAQWYEEHLGFEPVGSFDFWATGIAGGPLQISADGGATTLALFEASDIQPVVPQVNGVAFRVDADVFIGSVRSLPRGIRHPAGPELGPDALLAVHLCLAIAPVDPWGNRNQTNCH